MFNTVCLHPDGRTGGVDIEFKNDSRNWLITKAEFNSVVRQLLQLRYSTCGKIPVLKPVSYEPVWCTLSFTLPCEPHDQSVYDNCLLSGLEKLSGLSKSASTQAEHLVKKNCIGIARDPSWMDKLKYN